MSDYPHVPAAFINAIAEEGTKAEAIEYLQKQWNENCALRAHQVEQLQAVDELRAQVERQRSGLSEARQSFLACADLFDVADNAEGYNLAVGAAGQIELMSSHRLPTEPIGWKAIVGPAKDAYWNARRDGADETSALLHALDVAVALASNVSSSGSAE